MKIRFILFCCIIFAITGCSKNKVETIYIPEYLKQYGLFQVGSYWVFRNELTGMLDSNFISVPPKFSFRANYSPNPTVQVCDILYGGTLIQGSELTIGLYTISFKSGNGGNCLKNKIFQPGYIDQEDQNHTYKEVNSFDSLIVNNVKYFNVICTQSQFVGYNGEKPLLTFYLGKYVGLIKYDQKIGDADTTWSLVRYNVIQ